MTAPSRFYFAYGSNMNPARMASRGLATVAARGARLGGFALRFDKMARAKPGVAHANISWAPPHAVEGVLYELTSAHEITKMDAFERAPVNYSRDLVRVEIAPDRLAAPEGGVVETIGVWAWTYFGNRAVLAEGLRPDAEYLGHLLAGAEFLTRDYHQWLASVECVREAPSTPGGAQTHARGTPGPRVAK